MPYDRLPNSSLPHFKKRLPAKGLYIKVVNCPGITMPEVQDLLSREAGLTLSDEQISLDRTGFVVALLPDDVGRLLNGYLRNAIFEGGIPTVRLRLPEGCTRGVRDGLISSFEIPAEWGY
jgi:hypothetical protein